MRVRFVAWLASGAALLAVAMACLPDLDQAPPQGTCGTGIVDLADGAACDPGETGTIGCTQACRIDCDGGVVDDATNHCYFWTQPVLSLDLAVQKCGELNAHPVTFVDFAELQFVAQNTKGIPNAAGAGSWVALEKGPLNDAGLTTYYVPTTSAALPGWALSCPGCFAYTDAADIPLPTNDIAYPCVYWRHSLQTTWTQAACTLGINDAGQVTNTVLCEREPPGSFASPCAGDGGNVCIEVPVTRAKKRYELSSVAAIFSVAQSACSARGGTLVRFESAAEREEVITEVARSITSVNFDCWIGLYFNGDAGAWTWVDGTPASPTFPTPWADLQPSGATGAAAIHVEPGSYVTQLARPQDPGTTLPYVCEFAK